MRKCEECGHGNPDGQKFCGECGARLPEPPAEAGAGGISLQDNVINRSRIDARQTSAPVSVGGLHVYAGQPGVPSQATPEFCAVCGFRIDDPELRCPRCREFVHIGCYLTDERMCRKCSEERPAPVAPVGPAAVPPAHQPELAQSLPSEVTEHGIELVLVPAGAFMMGSAEAGWGATPVHQVYLDAYYIGKHPITQAQYRQFVGDTGHPEPGSWDTRWQNFVWEDEVPVTVDHWADALAYCRWLSRKTGQDWRLPTEAEWEKAARGTDGRQYPWGDQMPSSRLCNYGRDLGRKAEVGSYPAGVSPCGCHDMAGNVREWCSDWFDAGYYARSPERNPTGPSSGEYRVHRGGAWYSEPEECKAAARSFRKPRGDQLSMSVGFRVARSCR